MLHTNLKHVLSADEHKRLISENENVMICCGRMGPMCIPVYAAMSNLQNEYDQIIFADMEFDIPDAAVIREDPACHGFMGLPFVVYYRHGKLVHATGGIQSEDQIRAILEDKLPGEK